MQSDLGPNIPNSHAQHFHVTELSQGKDNMRDYAPNPPNAVSVKSPWEDATSVTQAGEIKTATLN